MVNFNDSKNESNTPETLRDLIGDVKHKKVIGYHRISETTNGCLTNIDLGEWGGATVEIEMQTDNTGFIFAKHVDDKWPQMFYAYFENGKVKIISDYPGDERGCCVFGDVFITSGHDGNYLWNIKTGEFMENNW
jgi:hypothetical protein